MVAYALNNPVRVSVTFTVAGAVTDPTTITLTVRTPAGVITSYTYALGTVSKTSTGLYYKDLTTGIAGTWTYTFIGTGTCAAEDSGEFFCNPSEVD